MNTMCSIFRYNKLHPFLEWWELLFHLKQRTVANSRATVNEYTLRWVTLDADDLEFFKENLKRQRRTHLNCAIPHLFWDCTAGTGNNIMLKQSSCSSLKKIPKILPLHLHLEPYCSLRVYHTAFLSIPSSHQPSPLTRSLSKGPSDGSLFGPWFIFQALTPALLLQGYHAWPPTFGHLPFCPMYYSFVVLVRIVINICRMNEEKNEYFSVIIISKYLFTLKILPSNVNKSLKQVVNRGKPISN